MKAKVQNHAGQVHPPRKDVRQGRSNEADVLYEQVGADRIDHECDDGTNERRGRVVQREEMPLQDLADDGWPDARDKVPDVFLGQGSD